MDSTKILELIEKKKKEHDIELKGCQTALETLLKKLQSKTKPDIVETNKLAILKDKMMFHKACRMQLEDLINEIK